MQLNIDTIPKNEHENVMSSFWIMMRECENRAINEGDPVLKHWVAQWAEQWNRITGDNFKPRWVD
jgi:hypothetical protein